MLVDCELHEAAVVAYFPQVGSVVESWREQWQRWLRRRRRWRGMIYRDFVNKSEFVNESGFVNKSGDNGEE